MTSPPPIIVATEDRDRLLDLVAGARANQVAEQLEAELERAQVIPLSQVPGDVVVMNSALEYEVVGHGTPSGWGGRGCSGSSAPGTSCVDRSPLTPPVLRGRCARRGRRASRRLGIEGGGEVGDQVVGVLEADRQAQQIGWHR